MTTNFENNINMDSQYSLKGAISDYIEGPYNYDNVIRNEINQTSLYTLQADYDEVVNRNVVYYFDVIKSHKVQLQAQITDYWLENTTAVQDSINIAPIVITLSGLVGELVYQRPRFVDNIVDYLNSKFPQNGGFTFTQKLGAIPSLVPSVDNYTQLAKNAINYGEQAFNRYKKIYDQVINWKKGNISNTKLRQQQIFETFRYFWESKVPLIVNTPYGEFTSMYIQNVNMDQGETNTVSEITVTLKQLKFKEVNFTAADQNVLATLNQQAQAETENLGKTTTAYLDLMRVFDKNYGKGLNYRGPSK